MTPNDKQDGDPDLRSTDLLDALRTRFLARSVRCSTHKQAMIADGCWHEAHEAELRRGIWLMAADMAQEEYTATIRSGVPTRDEIERLRGVLERLRDGDFVGAPINRGCGAMMLIEEALSPT